MISEVRIFYAFAEVKLKSLFFLDVALRHFAFGARRFEIALRSRLLGSKYPVFLLHWTFLPLKMRPPRCLAMSGTTRTVTRCHIREERGRRLKIGFSGVFPSPVI